MRAALYNAQQGHLAYTALWHQIKPILMAGRRVEVRAEAETRTIEQNKAQWPILNAFADQLLWPVNGSMVKMDADEWKDVLTAAFYQETVRIAHGLNGGVVLLGRRTSKIKRQDWSEWMEFLNSTAVARGVKVPAPKRMMESA
jgi:hypothetical protein